MTYESASKTTILLIPKTLGAPAELGLFRTMRVWLPGIGLSCHVKRTSESFWTGQLAVFVVSVFDDRPSTITENELPGLAGP